MPTLFPGFKKAEAVGTTLISFIFLGAWPYPAGVTLRPTALRHWSIVNRDCLPLSRSLTIYFP